MNNNETIAGYLESRLKEMYGQHSRIAAETGISASTIGRIARGGCSTSVANADLIIAWLRKYDAETTKIINPRPRHIPHAQRTRRTRSTENRPAAAEMSEG